MWSFNPLAFSNRLFLRPDAPVLLKYGKRTQIFDDNAILKQNSLAHFSVVLI